MQKTKRQKFEILSPDGFSIIYGQTFTSMKTAEKIVKKWIEGYERQGYYSSVKFGRIPLNELPEYLTINNL